MMYNEEANEFWGINKEKEWQIQPGKQFMS